MALRVGDLLVRAQDRVPFYTVTLCPKATQRRLLSDIQRRLCAQAIQARGSYLAQRATVFLVPTPTNAVGTAGAGIGSFGRTDTQVELQGATGNTQTLNLANAPVLVSARVITSATATTITFPGVAWATNQWQNRIMAIVAGRGAGVVRTILSNTATTLTFATNAVVPDATSLVGIYDATGSKDENGMVVLELPAMRYARSYVTKIDGSGNAYIDLESPLTARYDAPIPLPPHSQLLGVQAWAANPLPSNLPHKVEILHHDYRSMIVDMACYELNQQLYLLGNPGNWNDVQSLEVKYQPVPLTVTTDLDYLLLPNAAEDAIVANLALAIALRMVAAGSGSSDITAVLRDDASKADEIYLNGVRGAGVARSHPRVDAW